MATLADLQAERERLKAANAKADFEAALAETCAAGELVAAGNQLRRLLLDALDAVAGHFVSAIAGERDETRVHLREVMPQTAAFIDALRDAFGKDAIDGQIRKGMHGLPGFFHARENGHEVGTPALPVPPGKEISVADMQLGPFNPANKEPHADRNRRR